MKGIAFFTVLPTATINGLIPLQAVGADEVPDSLIVNAATNKATLARVFRELHGGSTRHQSKIAVSGNKVLS